MTMTHTRRRFLTTLSMVGAAGLVRIPSPRAAEGALETTRVRLSNNGSICLAPAFIAEELLRADGFSDVGMWTCSARGGRWRAPGSISD